MNNSVVVAMVTFYKSTEELRFRLACQTIKNAVENGHLVVIVDGSPGEIGNEIREKFKSLSGLVYPELHRGLGPSKRQSFFHAHEKCVEKNMAGILATEAEKDLSKDIEKLVEAIHQGANVVVPARTKETWKTWPEFQQKTEKEANEVFNSIICSYSECSPIDIMKGPVLFTPRAASAFIVQNPKEIGFPDTYAQHLGILISIAKHKGVKSVEVSFTYPEAQRIEEENALSDAMKAKRLEQRDTLIAGYKSAARFYQFKV